jgi:hypothetical protein
LDGLVNEVCAGHSKNKCFMVVRSKNNTFKGKGKFHVGNKGKTKKYEPVSHLFFEGYYNTEWVLYCNFIL